MGEEQDSSARRRREAWNPTAKKNTAKQSNVWEEF